jgi:DNA replication protein DnaC
MLSSTFVDEMGYLPLDDLGATIFFQLVSARYERGRIILSSNKSYGDWGGTFGDRHPLTCSRCQERLELADTIIAAFQAAAAI